MGRPWKVKRGELKPMPSSGRAKLKLSILAFLKPEAGIWNEYFLPALGASTPTILSLNSEEPTWAVTGRYQAPTTS